MIAWQDVYSETVGRLGYDPETKELCVTWNNSGKTSVYSGVPVELFDSVANSWSVGSAIASMVKPHYKHHYQS